MGCSGAYAATATITAIGAMLRSVGQLRLKAGREPGKAMETAIKVSEAGGAAGREWTGSEPVFHPVVAPTETVLPARPDPVGKFPWAKVGIFSGLGLGLVGGGYWAYKKWGGKKPAKKGPQSKRKNRERTPSEFLNGLNTERIF